jgi:hypothetical protein
MLSNNQCTLVNLRCISTAASHTRGGGEAALFAFWPSDYGRRSAARKDTAPLR